MKQSSISSKTIVFVHGLFVNPESWTDWKSYFEAQGYTTHAPANPYHSGNPSQLREQIPQALGKSNFEDLINNLVKFIDALPEKPILVGHSLGGLAVQKIM